MAYIGQSLTEGTRRVYTYVATASQTTFNAVYGVGAVDVYQNGILLAPADYTASDGTTVVLGTGAAFQDEITVVCHNTFSVADTVSASQGGTFNNDITVNGDLTVDTNTLYVDSTNNRVGIGTSSPDAQLDIESATKAAIRLNHTPSNYWEIQNDSSLRFNRGGTEHINIDLNGNMDVSGGVYSGSHIYSTGGANNIQGSSTIRSYSALSLSPSATDVYYANQGIIPTGTYLLSVYVTGSPWYSETWVGIMRWYNSGTNSNNTTDIYMTGMGHAPNNSVLYARVQRRTGNTLNQSLQLWSNTTSSPSVEINVKRLA